MDWGRQVNALIESGGLFITCIFPLHPPRDYGPPFYVELDHHIQALGPNWESVLEKILENIIKSHVGYEYLVVWKKF